MRAEIGLDGVIEREQVFILLDSGSGDGLCNVGGPGEGTSKASIETCTGDKSLQENARVGTAFVQGRTVTTQTVYLNLKIDTAWGKVWAVLSCIALAGLDDSSTGVMVDLRPKVMALSGDGTRST